MRVKIMQMYFLKKDGEPVKINIASPALMALERLKMAGFEGFVVGGCVRDSLIGNTPSDWDICTNALPSEISTAFFDFKVIETGLKHGTLTVLIDKIPIEITTFRKDGAYSDSRHPENVTFVSDIKEDLSRRDFTVNAMAFSPETGLLDFFGGKSDLQKRLIKCVGEPDFRFDEDALRILRAVRFSATLSFEIENETAKSILKNKEKLLLISPERISNELNKLLLGDNVYKVLDLYREVLAVFIPEIRATFDFKQHNPHHSLTVYNHIIKSVEAVPKDLILRLTMLLHDVGKPQCFTLDKENIGHFKGHQKISAELSEAILKRLKYDSATVKKVTNLVYEHDNRYPPNPRSVKRFMQKYDYDFLRLQNKVRRADCTAQSLYFRTEKLDEIDKVEEVAKEVLRENECFKLKDLEVNGNDLISLGIKNGVEIGEILDTLLNLVVEDELLNEREILLKKAIELR